MFTDSQWTHIALFLAVFVLFAFGLGMISAALSSTMTMPITLFAASFVLIAITASLAAIAIRSFLIVCRAIFGRR